jgi:energy-coupling factor transporter ATP-binding protein EcfA2
MRIKRLRLKNGYKRFHDLTIDLGDNPARIVALVGPNGSGKSSVLDGLLYHHSSHQRLGNTQQRDATYHSMNGERSFDYNNVEIHFTEGGYDQIYSARQRSGRDVGTMFSFRSPYRYNNYVKISEIRAVGPITKNQYGASDAASLDTKMEENYRRLQAAVHRYMQDYDTRPSEARLKIIGELNASITTCLDLRISNVGNVEGGQGTLYFSKPGHPKDIEFNVLSSGEKEVIDLLLDMYLRKYDYNQTIFLIDEPELHINTSIQGNLLKEVDRLVGDNCQIWLTTHSIGFLRALQTEMKDRCQVIQFAGGNDLASTPVTLTPMRTSAAGWRNLFAQYAFRTSLS